MMITGAAIAQSGSLLWRYDKQRENCGTWKLDSSYYGEWSTVDTISNAPVKTKKRDWVYDMETEITSSQVDLVYYPCGRNPDYTTRQFRICKITGIRQQRYGVVKYKYIPPPKSEFQRALDSLLNKKMNGDSVVIRLQWDPRNK